MEKTEEFTWKDFDVAIERLVAKLKQSNLEFENIYGVPRGGLIIATVLCHRLSLPLLLSDEGVGSSTLVVDDICDSGKTLLPFVSGCATAVLHVVPTTLIYPNFFVHVRKSDWVIYPWEVNNEQRSCRAGS